MTDNLYWWFQNGLMERSTGAIEKKVGARPTDLLPLYLKVDPHEDGNSAQVAL